jgi:hypothetical protein
VTWIIGIGAVVGLAFAYVAFQVWLDRPERRARLALKGDRQLLAGCAEGQVLRVAGRVKMTEYPLVAPLSKRSCCYWEIEIVIGERYQVGVGDPGVLSPRIAGQRTGQMEVDRNPGGTFVVHDRQDFELIDDADEAARVRMQHARLSIDYDRTFESSAMKPPTVAMRELLNNHVRMGGLGLNSNQVIRYREGILEQGERIVVQARTRHEVTPGSSGGYRDVSHRVELIALEEGELYVSDEASIVDG